MKYFQRVSIEDFVRAIVMDDRETTKITDSWNMERDEVISVLVGHFQELGIFFVDPMGHAALIYDNIHLQLRHSPELIARLNRINEEIERAKARHSRHS